MELARPGTRRTLLFALAVAWAVIVAGAIVVGVANAEEELGDRAAAALDDAGIAVDDLSIDGRDAVVAAPLGDHEAVEDALADVAGIRTVRFVDDAGEPVVAADEAPGGTSTSTTSVPPTTQPTTTAPPPPPGVAYLEASLEAGAVVIKGAIPDEAVAAQVAALADLVYAPYLDNQLVVDDTLETAPWVANTAGIVTRLPIVGTSSIRVVGNEAVLSGLAPNEERLGQLIGAMQQALGPDVSVTSEIVITGFDPPFVHAEAPGDGTVRLSGTMPSEQIVQLIAGTAIQVFGEDAVVNELEVGDNIDTTFSLFRLPLTFVAFERTPQWEVTIDDDVITGALRGGATFPSGSAKLTPEIEALMPVAAGILARNPTLGMIIEGYTDSVGSSESNLRLSLARAEAARQWLIEAGIQPERVLAVGYGEDNPIGDNETSEGRALNRRVEFVLAPASALGERG